jgi:hypothetical protein
MSVQLGRFSVSRIRIWDSNIYVGDSNNVVGHSNAFMALRDGSRNDEDPQSWIPLIAFGPSMTTFISPLPFRPREAFSHSYQRAFQRLLSDFGHSQLSINESGRFEPHGWSIYLYDRIELPSINRQNLHFSLFEVHPQDAGVGLSQHSPSNSLRQFAHRFPTNGPIHKLPG